MIVLLYFVLYTSYSLLQVCFTPAKEGAKRPGHCFRAAGIQIGLIGYAMVPVSHAWVSMAYSKESLQAVTAMLFPVMIAIFPNKILVFFHPFFPSTTVLIFINKSSRTKIHWVPRNYSIMWQKCFRQLSTDSRVEEVIFHIYPRVLTVIFQTCYLNRSCKLTRSFPGHVLLPRTRVYRSR